MNRSTTRLAEQDSVSATVADGPKLTGIIVPRGYRVGWPVSTGRRRQGRCTSQRPALRISHGSAMAQAAVNPHVIIITGLYFDETGTVPLCTAWLQIRGRSSVARAWALPLCDHGGNRVGGSRGRHAHRRVAVRRSGLRITAPVASAAISGRASKTEPSGRAFRAPASAAQATRPRSRPKQILPNLLTL